MSRVKRPQKQTAQNGGRFAYERFVMEHLTGFALAQLRVSGAWIRDAIRAIQDGMPCLAEKLLEECSASIESACRIVEEAKRALCSDEKHQ